MARANKGVLQMSFESTIISLVLVAALVGFGIVAIKILGF
jgi:hypothetical protein